MKAQNVAARDTENLLDRARATLASTFGFPSFRPLQEEIVGAVLRGEDVFVLMPTGGGKSLCYQLPALLFEGTTIVVSPLIALMKDQVDALNAHGIPATFINSSLQPSEIRQRAAQLARGETKLLYVAPERLMMESFLSSLKQVPIAFVAVDEAHCISEWGHDFRPEYRQLARLRELFPSTPFGAFTATATLRVRADIKKQLGLEKAASFLGSFNRHNLFYEVRPKKRAYDQIAAYIKAHPGASGIIYCFSRNGTEELAEKLRYDCFHAAAYHAGLEPEDRRRRQEAFARDEVPIIAATIAFGMGIDKPDVRFVIHHDMPKSLEGYYQESGRAGRDGEPSDCILFYSPGDKIKQRMFIDEIETEKERSVALWQLEQMAGWAESVSCRRRELLAYFDEELDGQEGVCCDLCRAPASTSTEDATVPAQMFLSCIKRTGERFGAGHIISVLRGSQNERVLRLRHDRLSTYGIGRDRSEDQWRALAQELIRGGYVRQDPDKYSVLSVTDRGNKILFGGERFALTVRQVAEVGGERTEVAHHAPLFERLRALRKRLADERNLPPYVIFHDNTLRQMAALLPTAASALRRISGVGERKALDFGPVFLHEIAAYVAETGATPIDDAEAAPSWRNPPPRPGSSARVTLDMFRAGQDVETIASVRGFTASTIEGHLAQVMDAGEELDVDRLVPPERRQAIEAAFSEAGSDMLGPALELLGDGYSYGELRIVRAALRQVQKA